jgi:hypothetical protein
MQIDRTLRAVEDGSSNKFIFIWMFVFKQITPERRSK